MPLRWMMPRPIRPRAEEVGCDHAGQDREAYDCEDRNEKRACLWLSVLGAWPALPHRLLVLGQHRVLQPPVPPKAPAWA